MNKSDSAAAPSEPPKLEEQLVGAARYVQALPRGSRAVLRRLHADPFQVPPQEFWSVMDRYQIPASREEFWLHVLPLMVRHHHEPGVRPGVALAGAKVSAARVERWLRLDHTAGLAQAGRLLSHLKDGGLDWARFGRLLWFWNDYHRRELARDYFRSPEFRQRTTNTPVTGAE